MALTPYRKKFIEMAVRRRHLLDFLMRQENAIVRHLIKLRQLDMGDLDYTPLKTHWREEVSGWLTDIYDEGDLTAQDWFLGLYNRPLTSSSTFELDALLDMSALEKRIKRTYSEVERENQKRPTKRPLYLKPIEDSVALAWSLKQLYWRLAQQLATPGFDVGDGIQILIQEGF